MINPLLSEREALSSECQKSGLKMPEKGKRLLVAQCGGGRSLITLTRRGREGRKGYRKCQQYVDFSLKFKYSEKATKIWSIFHFLFDIA